MAFLERAWSGVFGSVVGAAWLLASPANGQDQMQEALRALRLLGADVDDAETRCQTCHSVNIHTLNKWMEQTWMAQWQCLNEQPNGGGGTGAGTGDDDASGGDSDGDANDQQAQMTPLDRVNCLRTDPADPASPFAPKKLGMFTAGAHLTRFSDLFQAAFPADQWQARYAEFKQQVQMPLDGRHQLTQENFDAVLRWTVGGMPLMERILGNPGDAPRQCTPSLSTSVAKHLDYMRLAGWEARNRESGMQMFACSPGKEKLGCFDQTRADGSAVFPDAKDTAFGREWAKDFPASKMRVLRELGFQTSYWMRSSADGRFLANGYRAGADGDDSDGSQVADDRGDQTDPNADYFGGMISDLQPHLVDGAGPRDIKVRGLFDPSFFADQSGFLFQGSSDGTGFCPMSILTEPTTTQITFREPQCTTSRDVGLYQSVGSSLGGGDHLAAVGQFDGDGGSGRVGDFGDGQTSWMEKSYLNLVPIVNDGQRFRTFEGTRVWTPWLGDWSLSPSNAMASSRVAGVNAANQPRQMGYRFQFVRKTSGPDGVAYSLDDAATFCVKGGKGGFSFDERFYSVFHYVDADDWAELGFKSADDPVFKDMINKGAANVYVMDLLTGATRRVTRMEPGQFAMFPHYRSDGWLYFMVFDRNLGKRWAVASDATLLMAQ